MTVPINFQQEDGDWEVVGAGSMGLVGDISRSSDEAPKNLCVAWEIK